MAAKADTNKATPTPTVPPRRKGLRGFFTPAQPPPPANGERRHRQSMAIRRPAGAVVATPMQPVEHTPIKGQATGWQRECYDMIDQVPTVGYLVNLKANTLALGQLRVEEWRADEQNVFDWRPSESRVANDRLSELQCEVGGQQELLRRMGLHMEIAGRFYLLSLSEMDAFGKPTGVTYWEPYSVIEMTVDPDRFLAGTPASGIGQGKVKLTSANIVDVLPANLDPKSTAIVDCMRRSAKLSTDADSPLKRLLPAARQFIYLNMAIDSVARSRANGGLFFWPIELTETAEGEQFEDLDDDDDAEDLPAPEQSGDAAQIDPETRKMWLHYSTPVEDPGMTAAWAPALVRGPAELKDKIGMIDTSRPLDNLRELRSEVREEMALGYDAPKEKATGMGSVAGWGAYSIDADWNRRHVLPVGSFLAEWATKAVFRTLLVAPPAASGDAPMSWDEASLFRIVFDGAGLESRVDQTTNATVGLDRNLISESAGRTALGFEDGDAPGKDEILRLRAWNLAKAAPVSLAPYLLTYLGFPDELSQQVLAGIAAQHAAGGVPAPAGPVTPGGETPQAPPQAEGSAPTPEGPATTVPDPTAPASAGSVDALVGVSFQAGLRAAERIGARCRSRFDKLGDRAGAVRTAMAKIDNDRLYASLSPFDREKLGVADPVGQLDPAMWGDVERACDAWHVDSTFFVELAQSIAVTVMCGQDVGLQAAVDAANRHLLLQAAMA